MEKVISLIKSFKTIFYLKKLRLRPDTQPPPHPLPLIPSSGATEPPCAAVRPSSPEQRLPSSRSRRSEPTAPRQSPPPPCHALRLPHSAAGQQADAPRPSHRPELYSAGTAESYRTDRTPPTDEPSFGLCHLRTRHPMLKPTAAAARVRPSTESSELLSPHPRAPPSGHPFR
jgi:hypothetical protein